MKILVITGCRALFGYSTKVSKMSNMNETLPIIGSIIQIDYFDRRSYCGEVEKIYLENEKVPLEDVQKYWGPNTIVKSKPEIRIVLRKISSKTIKKTHININFDHAYVIATIKRCKITTL